MQSLPLPEQPASLRDIQSHLQETCVANGWDKNTIEQVFMLFTEEVGEVAKALRKELAFKTEEKPINPDHLEEELADVFNYLLELSTRFNIDLEQAYRKKMLKNSSRTWS